MTKTTNNTPSIWPRLSTLKTGDYGIGIRLRTPYVPDGPTIVVQAVAEAGPRPRRRDPVWEVIQHEYVRGSRTSETTVHVLAIGVTLAEAYRVWCGWQDAAIRQRQPGLVAGND